LARRLDPSTHSKEERARILGQVEAAAAAPKEEQEEDAVDDDHKEDKADDGSKADSETKAKAAGDEDENNKLSGRKGRSRPHGKISFEDLGRLISQRWQELKGGQVDYYKKKSDEDRKRYQKEMDEYRKKKAAN
jgi:hypothetical protein